MGLALQWLLILGTNLTVDLIAKKGITLKCHWLNKMSTQGFYFNIWSTKSFLSLHKMKKQGDVKNLIAF